MAEEKKKQEIKLTKQAKQVVVGTGVIALLIGGGIGAGIMNCVNPNKTMLTTNYGTIRESQIFDRIKSTQTTQTAAQSIIMEQVLEHYFPKAATDSKVNAQLKKVKANKLAYMEAVQQYGSDDALKANIKDSMLMAAAMKKEIQISPAQIKATYKTYRPGMTLAYVETSSKSQAEQFQQTLSQSQNYSDFKQQAKELSEADKKVSAGLLPEFNSLTSSQEMPASVKKTAMKMHKNETSDVIKSGNGKYAILFMKSDVKKGSYAQEKDKIKTALQNEAMSDQDTRAKVLAKYGKKAHVKAHDDAFKYLAKSFGNQK